MRATCPTQLILRDFIIRAAKLLIMQSSPAPRHFLPLGPNILFGILFSNALNLRFPLSMRDQVSHPNKTRGKIMVLYILILKFLVRRQEDKRSHINITQSNSTNWDSHFHCLKNVMLDNPCYKMKVKWGVGRLEAAINGTKRRKTDDIIPKRKYTFFHEVQGRECTGATGTENCLVK